MRSKRTSSSGGGVSCASAVSSSATRAICVRRSEYIGNSGVFSLARWRPGRRWLVLGLGLLATAVADAVYLFQSAEGTYVEGTWLDVLWPAAMLLVACAAWVGHDRSERFDVDGRPLLAVPAAGALTAIGVLMKLKTRNIHCIH